jgi:uncharacterized protein
MIRSCCSVSSSCLVRKSKNRCSIPQSYDKIGHVQQHTTKAGSHGGNPLPQQPSGSSFATTSTTSFAIGSLAGLLGSLAGMGGGFVMIPLMVSRSLGLRLTQHEAHGTSLFAVAATGFAGAISYSTSSGGVNDVGNMNHSNVVHYPEAAAIAVTAMITARCGAQATLKFSGRSLNRALGWFMLAMAPAVPAKAYYLQHAGVSKPHGESSPEVLSLHRLLYPALIGVGSGFLAGFFGVGGGTIVVPALTVLTDLTHHEALGTSLAAMTIPALSGTYSHYKAGNCAMRVAPFLAAGALVGSYLGAKLSLKTDESVLRWGFSALLLSLGLRTLLKA